MRLKNPNYAVLSPVQQFINDNKAAIQNFFTVNADMEYIDFDYIRAQFPGVAGSLTDGVIHQICDELGIKVLI